MPAATVVDTSVLRGRNPNSYIPKSVAGGTAVTLTSEEMQAGAIDLIGVLTAAVTVNFPLLAEQAGHSWRLRNLTTGPFALTVKATGQTGFVLERGEAINALYNGTDLTKSLPPKIASRYELKWVAGQHGKPGLNPLLTNSVANYAITDRDFEILGTNAVSADTSYNPEGGILIQSHGADNDQTILLPHLLANCSPWTAITWGTDQETEWEAHIKTGASIATQIIWAGLKLTNTPVVATDNDQVFLRYENAVNGGRWQAIASIANADVATDSGVTVVVATEYLFQIKIDAARVARFYINGALVATSAALTNATDFKPYIGIQANGAATAFPLGILGAAISRKYA